ncbi:MAG: Aerobic respiration control sensor protein ArcB [Pseudomonadota bacterium]
MPGIKKFFSKLRLRMTWIIRKCTVWGIVEEIASASETVAFWWDLKANQVYVIAGDHRCIGINRKLKFHSPEWWLARIHPEDRPLVQQAIRSIKPGQKNIHCSYRVRADDGVYKDVLDRCTIIWRRGGIAHIVGVTSDISLLVATRKGLEKACREAESASASKTRFLANMSHELRTPLGAIISSASLLEDQVVSDKERRRYSQIVDNNARQMLNLIDELLDLSKIEAGSVSVEKQLVDLNDITRQLTETFTIKAKKKGISLVTELGTGRPEETPPRFITTDSTRIRQIMDNLITNAIKFTTQGEIRICIRKSPAGDMLEIRVKDTGIGIDKSQLHRLFQPFEQLHHGRLLGAGGTGLGLNLSRKLAGLLGGTLDLEETTEDSGSTFLLSLPLRHQGNVSASQTRDDALHSRDRKKRVLAGQEKNLVDHRIMVVDDSEDNRLLMTRILQLRGADVFVAKDGQQALELLEGIQESQPATPMPLVLMDIEMPVMDGLSALGEIRKRGLPVKVVALTAHAMQEHRELYLQMGFDSYISKPVDRLTLVSEIQRCWHTSCS